MSEETGKCEQLKNATPVQLLEAAMEHYAGGNKEAERMMRLGFALAQRGGWELVAPARLCAVLEREVDDGGE